MQQESVSSLVNSVTTKALGMAALTVLMLWPLSRVEDLVTERQALQHRAFDSIAAGLGGTQILGPPVIGVPIESRTLEVNPVSKIGTETWTRGTLHVVPDEVDIANEVTVDTRSKGIYSLPVYVTRVVVTGHFDAETLSKRLAPDVDTRVRVAQAFVDLPVSGIKYLRSVGRFEVGRTSLKASSGNLAGMSALTAPLDLESFPKAQALNFRIEFEVTGSTSLQFLPLASTTRVAARVAWPHPDFDGAFLPLAHVEHIDGFSANWRVMSLNRSLPEWWRDDTLASTTLQATAFGVRLFQPSDIYTQNYRAVRYGILFVAITFVCFFAWEHLTRGVRLHPLQYLLVGLALAMFYLLLLALSEHVGFALSYALAAVALVALITAYLRGATRNAAAAATIGSALAAAYGVLYVILMSEEDALLFGALLLFAILSALMLATRKLDWRRIGRDVTDQIG